MQEQVPAPPRRGRKTSEAVARAIVRDIVDQRLQPGDKLPSEQELVQRYRVGRPALREAIRVLEVHELISVKPGPGGGPVVGTVTGRAFGDMASLFFRLAGTTFRELIEARFVLEPMCARAAAERQDPVGLDRLRTAVEREAATDLTDDARYAAVAADFHDAVARASGNGVLDLLSHGLLELYRDRLTVPVTPSDQRGAVRDAHRAIAEAVFAGDAARAEALTRERLASTVAQLERLLPGLLDQVIDWA